MNYCFFFGKGLSAISLYRAINVGEYLISKGHNVKYLAQNEVAKPQHIKGSDVVVVKGVPHGNIIAYAFLNECQANNAKLFIDADDDYFAVPESNVASNVFNSEIYQSIYKGFLERADRVIVSTNVLKDRLLQYNKNIHILPNLINWDWFERNVRIVKPQQHKNIRIAWAGAGLCHRDEFKYIREMLSIPDIEIDLLGVDPLDLDKFDIDVNRVNIFAWMPILAYYKYARHRNYDLMYAPLDDIYFNYAKSDIKILECYSIMDNCGCVASKSPPYNDYKLAGISMIDAIKRIDEFKHETREYGKRKLLANNTDLIDKAYIFQ